MALIQGDFQGLIYRCSVSLCFILSCSPSISDISRYTYSTWRGSKELLESSPKCSLWEMDAHCCSLLPPASVGDICKICLSGNPMFRAITLILPKILESVTSDFCLYLNMKISQRISLLMSSICLKMSINGELTIFKGRTSYIRIICLYLHC